MSVEVLSGKSLAFEIRESILKSSKYLKSKGIITTLAVVVATDDDSTDYYVRHIVSAGEKTDVKVDVVRLKSDASDEEISNEIKRLAVDSSVHGIILQTPLPPGSDANALRGLIPPDKDVDGANPLSAGRVVSGIEAFSPTTAVAVMEILNRYDVPVAGTHTVIIGRSMIVGKPLAQLLLSKDATVTICHSKTRNLSAITSQADILIVAIGKPKMITAEFVKKGSIVIDVGTNASEDGSLVGDVDSLSVQYKAGALSPVPGGVGPVTTALLLQQTILSAQTS